ncbi:trypsin-like peptidase domain-containing protein [bacterium]|nr:trypsin-like peptidase domain-containing protein [bacterium]MBO5446731.1 trypsin-like peptidase domain-containing protein [bacterium]
MKSKILFLSGILVLCFAFCPISMGYAPDEKINIEVYEKISPAIVAIDAQLKDGLSAGTGCIVTPDGLILTGSHVVENYKTIDVTTYNGQTYKARFIAQMGKNRDLALIKIEPKKPLKTVSFGDSENVKVGQRVLSIGNPFGFSNTLTQGIISRIDYVKNRFQTDAAINPGCSGGPLLNSDGEVIGISQSIYNPDQNISNIGIGFAIPSNDAVKFIATVDKRKIYSQLKNN